MWEGTILPPRGAPSWFRGNQQGVGRKAFRAEGQRGSAEAAGAVLLGCEADAAGGALGRPSSGWVKECGLHPVGLQ